MKLLNHSIHGFSLVGCDAFLPEVTRSQFYLAKCKNSFLQTTTEIFSKCLGPGLVITEQRCAPRPLQN